MFRGIVNSEGVAVAADSGHELFHLAQAEARLAMHLSTCSSPELLKIQATEAWLNAKRLRSIFEVVAAIVPSSEPVETRSNAVATGAKKARAKPREKKKDMATITYSLCGLNPPCPTDSIGVTKAAPPNHLASFHSSPVKALVSNSTTFTINSFLNLPPNTLPRLLLATTPLDPTDPAHLSWLDVGSPDLYSWTEGSVRVPGKAAVEKGKAGGGKRKVTLEASEASEASGA